MIVLGIWLAVLGYAVAYAGVLSLRCVDPSAGCKGPTLKDVLSGHVPQAQAQGSISGVSGSAGPSAVPNAAQSRPPSVNGVPLGLQP